MLDPKYFKSLKAYERSFHLHPKLIEIMQDMQVWCDEHEMPFVVTETVSTQEEDDRLKRVSKTHLEGRAFDISAKGWGDQVVDIFCDFFDEKYKDVAALKQDGLPLLVVFHDAGTGEHFHVQIRRLG